MWPILGLVLRSLRLETMRHENGFLAVTAHHVEYIYSALPELFGSRGKNDLGSFG